MISAADTKLEMERDPKWWKIPLLDFVDDFRRHRDASAISEPFILGDERRDAVLAGVIETLCDELGIEIPKWLNEVPACREPFFMSGVENLKAYALLQTPVRMRLKKVFVLENFLFRV